MMIARILTALLMLISAPAMAQSVPQERLEGVWRGTIGRYPVHVCFEWRAWYAEPVLQGVYYYDRYLLPISLDSEGGLLAERIGLGDAGEARWQVAATSGDNVQGTWSEGARSLPINLTRVDWQQSDEMRERPCEAPPFMAPRLGAGSIAEAAGEIGGISFTTLTYQPPTHFQMAGAEQSSIGIATFQLDEQQPGDAAINEELGRDLLEIGFAECFSMSLAANGTDGYFSYSTEPTAILTRFLGAEVSGSQFCGGLHPSHSLALRVFDRQSGGEIDLLDWLNDLAVEREVAGWSDDVQQHLSSAFLDVVLTHWPVDQEYAEDSAECRDSARTAYSWSLGIDRDGLLLIPQFPYVIFSCTAQLHVPWSELEPFLSIEGHAAAATF